MFKKKRIAREFVMQKQQWYMHDVQPSAMQMQCGYSEGELQACRCDVIVMRARYKCHVDAM
jgi:hypothetical protein